MTDPSNSQPRLFGWPKEFVGVSSHAPNTLIAVPLALPEGIVIGFGAIGKAAGAKGCLMLFADRAGAPGKLVDFTPPFVLSVGPQSIEAAAPIEIAEGTYWLASFFDRHAAIGIDYSDKGALVKWATHPFGAPPDFFPAATQFMGQRFNWWVSLQ